MKTFFTYLLLLLFGSAQAQDVHTLTSEALQLEQSFKEAAALDKLAQVLKQQPENYFALWKSSELYSRLGVSQPGASRQMAYFQQGKRFAEAATKVRPNDAEGYYALAVAMGRLALAGPNKDKIAAVRAIKSNAEKALRFNPNHGRAWHVLGKWHYEVSGLNFVERTAVRMFYGGFPESSIEQSIAAYEKAQRLEPNFALNYLELAKAYHRAGYDSKAIALLQRLAALPNRTGDDNRVKREGQVLMKKWS